MGFWNFYSAGQLIFGAGAVSRLGTLTARRGLRKLLIVTDPVLVEAGMVDRVRSPLEAAGCSVSVFSEGEPEPSLNAARACLEHARGMAPEAVLGLGGGSNMDLAKVTAVSLTHGDDAIAYVGFDNVPGPVTPIIAVPTTSGTGSEVSSAAVLTDTDQQMKVSTLSNYLRPTLAVVDPQLTHSCPPKVTADSGIDALTHAIEAYTATDHRQMPADPIGYDGKNPLSDCLAEKAIRLIRQHLVRAVEDGSNPEAREGMTLAATLAGLAFSNAGVALVHALEYPLGGSLHCSHGAGNGLLLPFVMEFNRTERTPSLAEIASFLGQPTEGLDADAAAQLAIDAVAQLKRDVGIPERIRNLGGTRDQLPGFAEKAYSIERLRTVNPRPASQQQLLEILESAW